MPLISVSWTLIESPRLRDKFDLNCKLGKGDQLFKFIGRFTIIALDRKLLNKYVISRK